ncbi:MAG: hypothetical protein GEU81_14820 [Nitriliruptorales bacterium]|nr:hypothetical protein [Nitriliruptorales bacterium]
MPSAPVASRPLRSRSAAALAAVALLVALAVVTGARSAGSTAPLPDMAADELLASVTEALADQPPISGEIAGVVELGLPDEALGGRHAPASAWSGDQRLRVWKSGDGLRVAHLSETSERAFITDGERAWTWDSRTLEATRYDVPTRAGGRGPDPLDGSSRGLTSGDPVGMAGRALAAVDDSTKVSVRGSATVAGRDAYRLLIEPRTDETLIDRVEIDVDAEERLPLRSAIYARDAAEPSIEAAFTSISFDPIEPGTFTFTPPPGAEVREAPDGGRLHGDAPAEPGVGASARRTPEAPPGDVNAGPERVRMIGQSWTTVIAVRQDAPPAASGSQGEVDRPEMAAGLEGFLPFNGPLFSARAEQVDDQRWLLIGAVEQGTLERSARALR